jgi:hypothetical protein
VTAEEGMALRPDRSHVFRGIVYVQVRCARGGVTMTDRLNVVVERGESGYVATSPDHPSLSGYGRTMGGSLVDLGWKMERAATRSAESAETACAAGVHKVNSSPSPAHLTRDGQEAEMSEDRIWSEHYTEADWDAHRPVPGAMEWLLEHWNEYAGRWVAVGANGLVAEGETFDEMRHQLRTTRGVMIAQVV